MVLRAGVLSIVTKVSAAPFAPVKHGGRDAVTKPPSRPCRKRMCCSGLRVFGSVCCHASSAVGAASWTGAHAAGTL